MLSVSQERAAREELERLASEQAALHRVARLAATTASPDEIFSAVAEEVARLSEADVATVLRYGPDDSATVVGRWGDAEDHLPVGKRLVVAGEDVTVSVRRTGRPAQALPPAGPPGSVADAFRRAGVQVASGSPIMVEGRLWGVAVVARAGPAPPPPAERRIPALTDLLATAIANAQARVELRTVAGEQAGLRRVATLVARGAPPTEVFAAVADEVGHVLPAADLTMIGRYDSDQAIEFVGGWSRTGEATWLGDRVGLGGHNVSTLVFERNAPARVGHLVDDATAVTAVARRSGARCSAGAPISVEGRLWGVVIVASVRRDGLPAGIEHQLAGFTELAATAIADAQAREELRGYADEQAALRRVATLIARGEPPAAVFTAVAEEVGQLFDAEASSVARYDPDGTVTAAGFWEKVGHSSPAPPAPLGGQNVSTLVFETGRPARIDRYPPEDASTATAVARRSGMRSAAGAPISVEGRLWGALQVAMSREAGLPGRTEERLAAFAELTATAIANAQARSELRGYAGEQAALRRVATLVAQGAPPEKVFVTVTEEIGRVLSADFTGLSRYEGKDAATVVGLWTRTGARPPIAIGDRVSVSGRNSTTLVFQTGRPVRIDDYDDSSGAFASAARGWGFRSSVGVPISVRGRLWGVVTVGYARKASVPADAEQRLADFTELVATAIANAEAQAELTASRARIVATADETRRRIERDLHDGAQQRLVTLALRLRAAQAAVPPELEDLSEELDLVSAGLASTLDELREYARGIHPAILAERGLPAALRALARRSPVPVRLDIKTNARLPERVEVTAYYVVSEALANAAKHAKASAVRVALDVIDGVVQLSVSDDGAGGADPSRGSGLVGLNDRVEAIGGVLAMESRPGEGTRLVAELPADSPSANPY